MNKPAALFLLGALLTVAAGPQPAPDKVPGDKFVLPVMFPAAEAPLIYEHSGEAGPDESFFLVGENLSTNIVAWGVSANNSIGQFWQPRTQFLTNGYLAATLPERAHDGPFVVWAKNSAGASKPILLNVPQPWWLSPVSAAPEESVRIFGRNLSRRPDNVAAFVYITRSGEQGEWVEVDKSGKNSLSFAIPEDFKPGDYEIWVHAGTGGDSGWGGPLKLHVTAKPLENAKKTTELPQELAGVDLQRALDAAAHRGGGIVKLPAGRFEFSGSLRIPAGVTLSGDDMESTTLQLVRDASATFARLHAGGWGQAPGRVHNVGDVMEYDLPVTEAGEWTVWVRYGTEMSPYKLPGVSGHMALIVDEGAPVPLENLPNTGSFGTFKWSKSALLKLGAGKHKLAWKNIKGGGISLDAFVLAHDPSFTPTDAPFPKTSPGLIVLQAEDCARFLTREGELPGSDRAAVWLSGDGAGITDLTIRGNAQVNVGIAAGIPEVGRWMIGCRIEHVRVADCDGKQAENCGVLAMRVDQSKINDNELWGRTPLFISGARRTEFARNRLVSVTRYGGNAEAAILGRTEPIEECVIEENNIASPPGAEAGGPTARRLLWFSTGHGSIIHNMIANNGVEEMRSGGGGAGAGQMRFGGVAGTDQNVGEMILFEGNHRTAYFGPIETADETSVTLPKTIPATPEERLGSVKREQLAHDAAGNETPFWPPNVDDGTPEPPLDQYFVTIMSGRGQGQTRRVINRSGELLRLNQPWRVAPTKGSVVVVGTGFYQNLIVGNQAPDGMTGVQLWISCMENVIAGNSIARQRKPGLFLYANGTTLASSMPRTWNRGISPLFWNLCEGNRCEECSAGALVTSGDDAKLPIEFPRALGNVLRHNSFIRSRSDGVVITSRKASSGVKDLSASVVGTIVELNVVRDAAIGYHAANSSDAILFRRNHAYFWYPVNHSTTPTVAFQIDDPTSTVILEQNSVEGIHGDKDAATIEIKR